MSLLRLAAAVSCSTILFLLATATPAADIQILDDCSNARSWNVVAADGVKLTCTAQTTDQDAAHSTTLKLDFNFVTGGGFAGIRRQLPLELPPNFEIAFSIRGDLACNNLEFKLVDDTGSNVWWVTRRSFEFPREWTRLASRRRHLQFAWGPSNAPLKRVSALEIVVSSVDGGQGTLYIDDLTFRPLPETKPYSGTPIAAGSTATKHGSAHFALDGNLNTAWHSASGDAQPALTIDFGSTREFGGLVLDWDANANPVSYEIQLSDDAKAWTTLRSVTACNGGAQYFSLPDSEARAIRLACKLSEKGENAGVGLDEIEVLPLEASRDANAFAALIASRARRGYYPRPFIDEGIFWTIVGPAEGDREALISEDGAVEVDKQAFSIEPFIFTNGRLLTWADAKTTQSLALGFVPVPTVLREYDGVQLSITAAADGKQDDSSLLLRYQIKNITNRQATGDLVLAIRPFQVNPPYQWLNATGGVARVEQIAVAGTTERTITIEDRLVVLGQVPDAVGCAEFDDGDITNYIAAGQMPRRASVRDPQHAASAAAKYHFQLTPGESREWAVCVPFSTDATKQQSVVKPFLKAAAPPAYARDREQAIIESWRAAVSTFDLMLPTAATDLANTIRSTLAYILINRDGVAIHPGSRSYERSWIRDGSLTATALLRYGLAKEARDFVDWYAPYQFESGKIPCVVDRRGPDPVPENDSHGQFIMAVMNIYRFTGDQAFLAKHWPRVQKAVAYIESLRAQRMTPEYQDPNTKATHQEPGKPEVSLHAFFGLVPESISHEGYSAKPMHSYWDDFFILRGLKDAAEMARVLDDKQHVEHYQQLADDFAGALYSSIKLTMKTHGIDYIPGCVELGDFDATSTTVALWPCGELGRLPRAALDRTFDKYWENFQKRRDDPNFAWTDYTPYELRCVGSLVLLGHPDRAREAMAFFLHDRRPPAWNQWPEVVYKKPRTARFLGDLPHTWCGSDFLNSIRNMFLFEREYDHSTVLLAGIPKSWINDKPIGFRNLPTYGGRVTCTIEQAGADRDPQSALLKARLEGDCPIPAGGFRLSNPLVKKSQATINGKPAELDEEGRIVIKSVPAIVELRAMQD